MALNLKNPEVERLAAEVSRLTGETKTQAIRVALLERRERLAYRSEPGGAGRVRRYLEEELWPTLPPGQRGRRLTKREEEKILGYGRSGA